MFDEEICNQFDTNMPNERRPTIGFLNASGIQFFHRVWRGVADVASENNVNAISFIGQYVRDTKNFKAQANILYDLVDKQQLDGLIIQDLMCNLLDQDEALAFYDRFRPLPTVSIGRRSLEGIPCVQSNGYEGMREAIIHLIEVHGCHQIAFIKGLPNYRPHDERYQAYVDVLRDYGLPFDSSRVAVPVDAAEGDHPEWGKIALIRLLNDQKAEIDALVTNDDGYAHALLPELQKRNIRVPDDVALVSFDDAEGSDCVTPPLTTVPIPIYKVGRKAAETMLDILAGKQGIEKIVNVPSDDVIVRQSCGCRNTIVSQVIAGDVEKANPTEPLVFVFEKQREHIVSIMLQVGEDSSSAIKPEWVERLYDDFVVSITNNEDVKGINHFLTTMDEILRQAVAAEDHIDGWVQVISSLRREILPFLSEENEGIISRNRIEDLWLQAQMLIGEVSQRVQAYHELEAKRQKRILNDISTALATNFDLNELARILSRELPRLGITRGYLSIYEDPQPYQYPQPAPEWSRLVLAFNVEESEELTNVEPGREGRRFLSKQLAPQEVFGQQRPYNLIVQAIYSQNEQIGFSVLEDGPDEGAIYDLLRAQISSALKGDLLFNEVQQARLSAEKADQIKTRLLANVSHELRTPLNIILGYSQDVLNNPKPYGINLPQELLRDLGHIFNSAEHQLRVVNDLLDLSRAEIDELDLYLELLDPYPLFQNAFNSIVHSSSEESVDWKLDLPERLPLMQVDPVRLRQILLNLLSNAQRFTDTGTIVLGVQVEPPHLHLWVQDTGEGISKAMQEQIFEPFVKVENAFRRAEGIGLGLSITRRLVALHGGSMQLESQLGKGSTFHVYLPLPNLSEKSLPITESTQPVILLISAGYRLMDGIQGLCLRNGQRIQQLAVGDDLDALLKKVHPMALAWDMSTATANEWALVRRVCNHPHLNQLPFILYGQDNTDSHAVGLTSVVTKPINAPTLVETIKAMCPNGNDHPILIVDDDPLVIEDHRQMISNEFPDHPILTAKNGKIALTMIVDKTPSLVLLDLMMPEKDGFEVLERMRKNPDTLNVPVIIMTNKVLNFDDIKRIEQYSDVILQTKDILTDDEMIAGLHRTLFGDESLPPQTSALVKQAVAYFHQNYNRPFKRWEVAEAIGASENYFSRVFNQELGLSPWDYLNRFRVNQASELLRYSSENVKYVASLVGFKDPKYFSRVFNKVMGVSPSEFRNQKTQ